MPTPDCIYDFEQYQVTELAMEEVTLSSTAAALDDFENICNEMHDSAAVEASQARIQGARPEWK